MDTVLFVNQLLNGIQLGLILFLLAAGLSLVFGIMDFINLAHGVFYMLGAYICATVAIASGSFILGFVVALPAVLVLGLATEWLIVRHFYKRDHLDQVLVTFGLVLCADTAVKYLWGPQGLSVPLPAWLGGQVALGGITLPAYRLFIVAVAAVVALALWQVIARTRVGMMVRASASNEEMARALGIETRMIFALVFAIGAVLAGIGGIMVAPITGASIGMGNQIVILALVVIIIGGIGSIFGAFVAAIGVGLIDTLGRAYLPSILGAVFSPSVASSAGPALASILIYLTMTLVLVFRPSGLFPPANR
ncbi:branched-chain amino acid ABC transporter permease [Paracoccus denitrificans]|uniref:Amino acid/amide ABC transporter membrane protein 1, HAAT family n=1 Tax=Paracoccus denitrificans (strain Pd 1222) TaxID=318586 RepID=A1AYE8_PARDP|nr:branched-chain amino acid ABC transporter permease [Paracoccus denitrificans]ABL68292.1 amino acid/amide ABC transporter membrane protein 1, HAAT family [Paracoccus denitrificans PD1222]MBB4627806.1 branched-chain amino acid transport system permease protein [Paracoccus denitrificans]MCU7428658.1 branched-chain amino acid ABC transporter permease [Paracoccus denitrificans]QAR26382.1 branched-chain amino acid ABC transporter permease [Paracoccus denitrificans]UPV95310.1 branched-chain amino 